jgi:(p)ppGpp synthase/HD superfamily hydrolase
MPNVYEGQALVDAAMALAIRAHDGQANEYDREPYVLHPLRVYCATRDGGLDEDHQAVALLHDTIEDTWVNTQYLMSEGFPLNVVNAIYAISKQKNEANEQYYQRVKLNLIARRVKIHDINDNLSRIKTVAPQEAKERLTSKYNLGLSMLCQTNL